MSSAHARQFPQPDHLQARSPNSTVVTLQPSERLLSPQEVADRLGVSERWVRDHATRRSPRIRAVKLGPMLRFRWSDVEDFLSNQLLEDPSKKPVRSV
jgi:excisionase family DNA binding protein